MTHKQPKKKLTETEMENSLNCAIPNVQGQQLRRDGQKLGNRKYGSDREGCRGCQCGTVLNCELEELGSELCPPIRLQG